MKNIAECFEKKLPMVFRKVAESFGNRCPWFSGDEQAKVIKNIPYLV